MEEQSFKENILFVDDEECMLEIAREFFEYKGYRVFTAPNGIEALKIIQRESIACCFTDINMPRMDGLELAERIRCLDNSIPVVIMTAYPSFEASIKTIKNGVVDFLTKPVRLENMYFCLKRVLRERKLFIENILLKEEVDRRLKLEKLNRNLVVRVQELAVLNKIITAFAGISESGEVFRLLVDQAKEVCRADSTCFYVFNELLSSPSIIAVSEKCDSLFKEENSFLAGLFERAARDALPFLLNNRDDKNPLLPADLDSAMIVPLKIREKVFGLLYLVRSKKDEVFSDKELYYADTMTVHAAYAIENLALYENIYENLLSTMYAFVSAIEAKDVYIRQHSERVAGLAYVLGERLGLDREALDVLLCAGRLHDIGKIGISDKLLLKSDRLTDEEYEAIKAHPAIGADIIARLEFWNKEQEIILHHHERYDGKGYPSGLAGDEIPFLARILSVADAYDAMASDRAYRKRLSADRIRVIMMEERARQFDPDILDVFLKMEAEGDLPHFN